MLYRFLIFCFVVLSSYGPLGAEEHPWLGCSSSDRFLPLTDLSSQNLLGYEEQFVPYLKARGVEDEASMHAFLQEDLLHIAQALSILFEQDSAVVLHNLLGKHLILIEDGHAQIDHVGSELYGPISFYVSLLEQMAPQLGLTKSKHVIFPSTQVVKVLQKHDPDVKGVTIGRIYFQSGETETRKCIELFQASLPDGQSPQSIAATRERLSLLTSSMENSTLTPIDHVSIEFGSVEDVQKIHRRLHQLASETLKPYQKEVSYNSGDGSTQTKAVMRESKEGPFNRIVEFVHYGR